MPFDVYMPKVAPKLPQSDPKVTPKWTQSHPSKQKNGRIPSHRPSRKLSIDSFASKLRRASFESIAMRFYEDSVDESRTLE